MNPNIETPDSYDGIPMDITKGLTPLMLAASMGHIDAIQVGDNDQRRSRAINTVNFVMCPRYEKVQLLFQITPS